MKKAIFLTVLAVIAIGAEAQTGKAPKATFDLKPFDTSLETLPVGYRGHDCSAMASVLKKQNTKKDEMETTDEYVDRMGRMSSIKLSRDMTVGDTVALLADIHSEFDVKFFADARTLYIMSKPYPGKIYVNGESTTWDPLVQTDRRVKNYRASNAYGSTVTVQRTDIKTCAVAFANLNLPVLESIDVVIKDVGADFARKAKAGVSFFYVGKLVTPFIHAVSQSRPPKIDFPFETHWTGDALVIWLEQVWAVEAKTGQILGKRELSRWKAWPDTSDPANSSVR